MERHLVFIQKYQSFVPQSCSQQGTVLLNVRLGCSQKILLLKSSFCLTFLSFHRQLLQQTPQRIPPQILQQTPQRLPPQIRQHILLQIPPRVPLQIPLRIPPRMPPQFIPHVDPEQRMTQLSLKRTRVAISLHISFMGTISGRSQDNWRRATQGK